MPAPHRYRTLSSTTALSVRKSLAIVYTFLLLFSVNGFTFFSCVKMRKDRCGPRAYSMHVRPFVLAFTFTFIWLALSYILIFWIMDWCLVLKYLRMTHKESVNIWTVDTLYLHPCGLPAELLHWPLLSMFFNNFCRFLVILFFQCFWYGQSWHSSGWFVFSWILW